MFQLLDYHEFKDDQMYVIKNQNIILTKPFPNEKSVWKVSDGYVICLIKLVPHQDEGSVEILWESISHAHV